MCVLHCWHETQCHICRDIVEVGRGVDSVREGDRVAMEPGLPCWSNRMSRSADNTAHCARV